MSVIDETRRLPADPGLDDAPSGLEGVLITASILSDVGETVNPSGDPGRVDSPSGFAAVLVTTSIFLPMAASLFTLVLLLSGRAWPLLWGTLAALSMWPVWSLLCRMSADARHAIPSSYGELLPRLAELEACLAGLAPDMDRTTSCAKRIAYEEAIKEVNEINRETKKRGITWLLASGYNAVWGRLYHAEEALIEIAPVSKVLEGAYRDQARLEGSDIKIREALLARLQKALDSLDPGAVDHDQSAGATMGRDDRRFAPVRSGVEPEQLARTELRFVRKSLNEYRNARWNGLILARNRLLATFGLTSAIIFVLLALALLAHAPSSAVIAAAAFYLVGATVGLGNRLRSESQAESAIPDYGLSAARLITIPLFSGLGALGGLVIVPYLKFAALDPTDHDDGGGNGSQVEQGSDGTAANAVPDERFVMASLPAVETAEVAAANASPPTTGAQGKKGSGNANNNRGSGQDHRSRPKLTEIFDLKNNLFGLVIAAIFGLTPALLFERLQQQSDRYKADLKSSRSTDGAPPC
jgi:hypothetical protein